MRFIFTGKNMSVEEGLKSRVSNKLSRLEKLVPDTAEVQVVFSAHKNVVTMEVSIPMHKRTLRAEATDADVSNCIDGVVDSLDKQVVKYKSRLRDRRRRNVATNDEILFIDTETPDDDASEINFIRTKKFAFKPMDAQEAVMEMELLNHSFYVFRNAHNDEVNVVYKRKDGEYGLIEPQ